MDDFLSQLPNIDHADLLLFAAANKVRGNEVAMKWKN